MTVRRNVGANFLAQVWITLIALAFIPIYISFLGLEAYGLVGVFALLQTWLSLLDLGLTPALNREMGRFVGGGHDSQSISDLLRSAEAVMGAIAVGVITIVWVASGWLSTQWLRADALSPDVVAGALALMGFVAAMRFIEGLYRNCASGLQRQVPLSLLTAASATIRALGAVAVLAWVSPTITAFFLWQAVVSVASAASLGVLVHRSLPPAPRPSPLSLAPLRRIWRFAGGSMLVTLLGFFLSQTDKVILSAALPLSVFAVYSVAYTVASSVRLFAQPIDQAVFPRMTQLHQQRDLGALAHLYHKTSQYNTVFVGGAGIFLVAFGSDLLDWWIRDAALAADTYSLVWILAIGMVLNASMDTPYNLQMASGWIGMLVKVNAFMSLVFVPAIVVMTLQFGATGAAVAWVLLNLTYVVIVARLMHRRLLPGELSAWYIRDLLMPLAAGAAAAATLRLLLPTSTGGGVTLISLAVAFVVTVAASAAASSYCRSDLSFQWRLVFRNAR